MSELTKEQYIIRNFKKLSGKPWEMYVITRVLHKLDDPEIEFICQQYINPPTNDKDYYRADLAFPTLKMYLEINEKYHDDREIEDSIREKEILEATSWESYKIPTYEKKGKDKIDKTIKKLNSDIDVFVNILRKRKRELIASKKFVAWDYEAKYSPETYIKRAKIHVNDNVAFRHQKDAKKLFGYKKGHAQNSYWRIKGFNQAIWFPKLYDNKDWINRLENNSATIHMQKKDLSTLVRPDDEERIVFAHNKNVLGQTVYKFIGVFAVDNERTNETSHYFNRVDKEIILTKYYK